MSEKGQKGVVNVPPGQKAMIRTEPLGPPLQFQMQSDKEKVTVTLSDGMQLTPESSHEANIRFAEAFKKTTGTDDPNYWVPLLAQVSRGMRDSTED